MRQIAALPYRIGTDGRAEVLLITSRETRRWIIPKGNKMRGYAPHEAAAQEAYEEAGVRGIPCPTALGAFVYLKRRRNGADRHTTVDVFPLKFLFQADDWPERNQREIRWFALDEAAAAVDEPDLKTLIATFRIPPPTPGVAQRMVPVVRSRLSEVIPMLRWFQALMPSQGRFFEQFESHSALLVAGAEALAQLLQGDDIATHIRTIVDREHDADEITRDVLMDVRRIFVTPFDRSAITGLIGVMDDAIDQMNKTAKAIELYEVTSFEPQMRDMSGIIVEAARITAEAIPLLRSIGSNGARLHSLTERLIKIEGDADDIHDAGIKALFKASEGSDALRFVVGREIYSHLERIVDRFEDVANEIQGLVIDHA
ncbi:DUF47 family protein [Sphingomonas montanisoli]|uniref:DUF47 family protein n=1 Tax=Sphingomonas montanisoli TaxID=2606412 RepID=A0A5D9C9N3_9SPHN|nr:DUF47 family protein [Sphingomonas montanisoli]TZG27987.1 DUF47 family protein [Sphingomonas montanisoli]